MIYFSAKIVKKERKTKGLEGILTKTGRRNQSRKSNYPVREKYFSNWRKQNFPRGKMQNLWIVIGLHYLEIGNFASRKLNPKKKGAYKKQTVKPATSSK